MKLAIQFQCLVLTCQIHAQDAKEELDKLNRSLLKASSFSVEMLIHCYEKIDDVQSVYDYIAFQCYANGCSYSNIGGTHNVVNNEIVLLINDSSKIIIVDSVTQKQIVAKSMLIDENLNLTNATLVLHDGDSARFISIIGGNEGIDSINVMISKFNHLPLKLSYFYKATDETLFEKVVVSFQNVKVNPFISDELFSTKIWIGYANGKFNGVGKRKDYKVLYSR